MKKDKDKSSQDAELRRLAEQRLRERKTEAVRPETEQDTPRLLQELRVRQVELETRNEELIQARQEVEARLDRYTDLYVAPVGYFILDRDGAIGQTNITGASLLGIERSKLIRRRMGRFVAPHESDRWERYLGSVLLSAEEQTCELTFRREDDSTFHARLESIRLDRPAEGSGAGGSPLVIRVAMSDITERKRAGAYGEIGREILRILNEPGDMRDSIQRVLAALKTRTGFDAVGIRLRDGDDFPYFAQKGFSKDFLLTENTLIGRAADGGVCRDKDGNVSLECTCGLVISGKTDPANPLFTPGGSVWTNDSFPLLDIPPGEDPRPHPRNECIHRGYASVALVPIRNQDGIVGLIQLNDRRKGRFTLGTVEILEGIASHIGAALMRKQAEEALRKERDKLVAVLESVTDASFSLDREFRLTYMNREAEKIFQKPRREMLGKSLWELFPEAVGSRFQREYERALAENQTVHFEEFYPPFDQWYQVRAYPSQAGLSVYFVDITERKRIDHAQQFLLQCGSRPTGEDFFRSLARYLAQSLGMDFVCIDRLVGDGLAAQTVAVYDEGSFQDNVEYTLKDTPCGDVVGKTICCFPTAVRQLFPKDVVLQKMMAESYVGTTLWSFDGKPIGLIAVIGRKPLVNPRLAELVLRIVAVRAAGELERKQAEDALLNSQQRYQSLFSGMTEGLALHEIVCDDNGRPCDYRFLDINPAFERLTGLRRNDVVGKTRSDVLPGDDPKWVEMYGQVALTGQPVRFEKYSSALERHYEVLAYRPAPMQVAVIFMDITDRKRAEALLGARLRLSELAQRGDMDEVMRAALDEAERLTGSCIGFFHFVSEDQEQLWLQAWSTNTLKNMCKAEGKGQHYPISQAGVWVDCFHARAPVIHNDYANLSNKKGLPQGHAPIVRDLAVPILRHGSVVAIMGVGNKATDYTQDDVTVLQALALPAMDLVTIKQAEEALQRTAEQLARSNKDLEQFAYVASHDLQEPLRQVTGFMNLLQDRYKGKLDKNADEYIQYGVDGASRMSNLIGDLLAYSRVNTGGKQPSVLSCQEALDRALANLGAAVSESKARVTHDSLPTLVADRGQITQLFQNLLGNAIKFRREGVDPEVHVGARREGDQWVLWVKDNGIGVPSEQFDRVFVIFQRLHSRSKYLGTGIGLAICKKIVERHGGRIWVESKVGEGSTFYFALPAARPA